MKKKTGQIMGSAVALLLAAAGTVQAVNWTGAALDGEWGNSNNWDTVTVPGGGEDVYVADPTLTDTVSHNYEGVTNVVSRHFFSGGMTFNMTGGTLNDATSGNTVRTFVGNAGSSAELNVSGGVYSIGHQLRIGIGTTAGGDGVVNLDGGYLNIYRGSYSVFNGNSVSISLAIGQQNGVLNLLNGTLATRVGVEVGGNGTFNVQGAGATISIGDMSDTLTGDGSWRQESNSVLRVGIASNGVSPILINDDAATAGVPLVLFKEGAQLDMGFVDGYIETNAWPILVATNANISNLGLVPAPGVDTNNWGMIISNNIIYVGYGLGWPFGEAVQGPPSPGRTLYWTGAGGNTASDNPTNWVLDTVGTPATWGPYSGDTWYIVDSNVAGVSNDFPYVVDYDGTALSTSQNDLWIGNGGIGTLNFNSGALDFTQSTSSRQRFGLNGGQGTLNVNAGSLSLNAAQVGLSGGTGWVNVNGGSLFIGRQYNDNSLYVGYDAGSTGTVHIAGGRLLMRGGLVLGSASGAIGTFHVEGSAATEIGIGVYGTSIDGDWEQHAGSTIKFDIDAGGITPIHVNDKADPVDLGGDVYFNSGSLLEVGFADGFSGANGDWRVMYWDGALQTNELVFASSVDTNVWSYYFVDSDGTNGVDQLWVKATGLAPSVVPNITSYNYNGGNVMLSWDSEAGNHYNVLSTPTMTNPSWSTNVAGIPGAGATTSTNVTASGGSQEFFRIEAY